jgi:2,3-bisphosphoglycerate-dependent phosphoglycerate mutase
MRNAEDGLIDSNVFTGWIDTDLNQKGLEEVDEAAVLMLKSGYSIDVTYTSTLKRAIRTAILLNVGLSQLYKPIIKSWKLVCPCNCISCLATAIYRLELML